MDNCKKYLIITTKTGNLRLILDALPIKISSIDTPAMILLLLKIKLLLTSTAYNSTMVSPGPNVTKEH